MIYGLCRDGIIDTKLFSEAEETPPAAAAAEGSPEPPQGAALFSQGEPEALKPLIQDLKHVREGEDAKAEEEKRLRLRKVHSHPSYRWKLGSWA